MYSPNELIDKYYSHKDSDVRLMCAYLAISYNINTETTSKLLYELKKYEESFDAICHVMDNSLSEDENDWNRWRNIQHLSIDKIFERYEQYDANRVQLFTDFLQGNTQGNTQGKDVTITMTSCKRYDLFRRTVSSFVNCCLDYHYIKQWIVIDDNSSDEDINQMKTDFPFLEIIRKGPSEKGHCKSMNMLIDLVKTPFFFHLEDDWVFYQKDNYLGKCIDILQNNISYGQCLLNRMYGERGQCYNIKGGFPNRVLHNKTMLRYYEHQYIPDQKDQQIFYQQNGGQSCSSCVYWPHYSLRVGMTQTNVWKYVGLYDEKASHFEMDYAYRYVKKGYKTCYLNRMSCYHIGRCTFERNTDKLNAYDLNKENQFGEKENKETIEKKENKKEQNKTSNRNISVLGLTEDEKEIPEYKMDVSIYSENVNCDNKKINEDDDTHEFSMSVKVVNLKRRPDRKKDFIVANHDQLEELQYSFFDGVDGQTIKPTPKILKTFETGDYKYRKGIVGCACSHMALWNELLISDVKNGGIDAMLIFEDDITLAPDFVNKLKTVFRMLPKDWDIVYLGHFMFPNLRSDKDRDHSQSLTVESWSREKRMHMSMGGTIGYVINNKGAAKMFDHVDEYGMTNAVDTVMNLTSANICYVYPHIVYSECVSPTIQPNSDIQYDFSSLCKTKFDRLKLEINYWLEQLNEKGIRIKDSLTPNELPIDNKSKIIYTEKIQVKEDLLTNVIFTKCSSINYMDVVNHVKSLPIYCYTIYGHYVVTVPETKFTDRVEEDCVWSGGYLNRDCPI